MPSFKFKAPARPGESGSARFFWRIGSDQYNKTIQVKDEAAATRRLAMIEETILDLALGKRAIPPGVTVTDFVISGGTATAPPPKPAVDAKTDMKSATLADLFGFYQANVIKDAATRYTEDIHIAHLKRGIGAKAELASIDLGTAQKYADRRRREKAKGRAQTTQAVTILKELKTLAIIWRWTAGRPGSPSRPGAPAMAKEVPFNAADIQFPAERPKQPFRTWAEIERTMARGGLTKVDIAELWECLYLDIGQIGEVLGHVETAATRDFLYPMLCAASYTGARRSELCRSRIDDWNLDEGVVQIRQKKKKAKREEFSYRAVDLNSVLKAAMRTWFENHPGGQYAFPNAEGGLLRPDSASYFLKLALAKSRWEPIPGWHTFRHSFASNLARVGTDQRYIDAWMGHHTEIRLRYQHLFPQQRRNAIESLIA